MDSFSGEYLISEEFDNEHSACVHNCPKFDFYILFIHEVTLFLMISLIMLIMQSLFA